MLRPQKNLIAPLVHMHSICISENSLTPSSVLDQRTFTNMFAQSGTPNANSDANMKKTDSASFCDKCQQPKSGPKCENCAPSLFTLSDLSKKIAEEQQAHMTSNLDGDDKLVQDIRDATFFDVGVMRCLLSPKWNTEGYLWSLEYLSHRVLDITDYILKEQDKFFKFKCPSMPSNLNDLFVLMGIGTGSEFDEDLISIENRYPSRNQQHTFYTNQFIDLVNQIYFESGDQTNNSSLMLKNASDVAKRRKYEANFQTRIR